MLPAERTKAGGRTGPRLIFLSPEALAIVKARHLNRRSARAVFVFPGARGEGPATGLRKPFLRVCAAAQLADLRIHDLRHSYASFALAAGASLPLISKALGHADVRSTERYAHASNDSLVGVARLVAAKIGESVEAAKAG